MEPRLEKGPVCGVENCRSRLYEEGEDGYRYCQNGHQQFGLIRAAEDDDDFTLATTTRTRKKKDTDDQVKIAKREYQLPVSPHHNVCTYKIN
jgi:RNA polymerase I-specific transcription initiation factor RRN7